jgi:hypothetical protein
MRLNNQNRSSSLFCCPKSAVSNVNFASAGINNWSFWVNSGSFFAGQYSDFHFDFFGVKMVLLLELV